MTRVVSFATKGPDSREAGLDGCAGGRGVVREEGTCSFESPLFPGGAGECQGVTLKVGWGQDTAHLAGDPVDPVDQHLSNLIKDPFVFSNCYATPDQYTGETC